MKRLSLYIIVFIFALVASLAIWTDALSQIGYAFSYLIWRGTLTLKAFDQKLIWALFTLVVSILICVRLFKEAQGLFTDSHSRNAVLPHNLIEKWESIVSPAVSEKKSTYSKWVLAENLSALYSQVYLEKKGINREQFKRLIKSGRSDLPDNIARFLLAGFTPYAEVEKRTIFSSSHKQYPLETKTEEIINHLEKLNGSDT